MGQILSAKLENRQSQRDQRNENRRYLSLQVAGSIESEESFNATVRDLSRTGFLMDSEIDISQGELIFVELPRRGRVSAQVAWIDGRLAGCQFLQPISSGSISAALLGALPEGRTAEANAPSVLATPANDDQLSFRQKAGIAVGLGFLAWGVIIAAGFMMVRLLQV